MHLVEIRLLLPMLLSLLVIPGVVEDMGRAAGIVDGLPLEQEMPHGWRQVFLRAVNDAQQQPHRRKAIGFLVGVVVAVHPFDHHAAIRSQRIGDERIGIGRAMLIGNHQRLPLALPNQDRSHNPLAVLELLLFHRHFMELEAVMHLNPFAEPYLGRGGALRQRNGSIRDRIGAMRPGQFCLGITRKLVAKAHNG